MSASPPSSPTLPVAVAQEPDAAAVGTSKVPCSAASGVAGAGGASVAVADAGSPRGVAKWTPLHKPRTWNAEEAKATMSMLNLSPPWRMLVLGDGSPTRHLHMLSGAPTTVDVLEMTVIGGDDGAPPAVSHITPPRLRRQVFLENTRGDRMGYATSWWNKDVVDRHLKDRKLPIWASLTAGRTEIFREIVDVYHGSCNELEEAFGCKGPFWGRCYLFWHGGSPMCLIYEVFSPLLCKYLGPIERTPPE